MSTLITVIHVMACVLLVLVVLLQSGKGADISASLAGSSQTVFGSSGGANFFTRFTGAMAAIFMVTSVGLTILGGQSRKSLFERVPTVPSQTSSGPGAPAAPPAQTAPTKDGAAPAAPANSAAQPEANKKQ